MTGVDWRWREDPIPGQHRAEIAEVASAIPIRNLVEAAVDVGDGLLERLVHGTRWLPRGLRGLDGLAAAHPHHPGVVRLLASGLVDAAAPESPAESELDELLTGLGALRQVWVTPRIRVDLLFPDAVLRAEVEALLAALGGRVTPFIPDGSTLRDATAQRVTSSVSPKPQ